MNGLNPSTKRLRYFSIKKFFDFIGKKELFLNNGIKLIQKKLLPEELLSETEVQRMIDSCDSVRDKAMLGVSSELGTRIGELMSLKIKHVSFDDNYGAILMLDGKSGPRRVLLVKYSSLLWSYMQTHPFKTDGESPLWMTQFSRRSRGKKKWVALEYNGFTNVLKDSAKRIGLTKRIYPHLLRHSSASKNATFMTESQLKEFYGWSQGSRQTATYIHLSGSQIDSTLLKHYGISTKEELEIEKNKLIQCPDCKKYSSGLSIFCQSCGMKFQDSKDEQSKDFIIELLQKLSEKIPEVKNIALEMAKENKWKGFLDSMNNTKAT
jgi:site-specific recombinase XerD